MTRSPVGTLRETFRIILLIKFKRCLLSKFDIKNIFQYLFMKNILFTIFVYEKQSKQQRIKIWEKADVNTPRQTKKIEMLTF